MRRLKLGALVGLMVGALSTPARAETVVFDNASNHPGGTISVTAAGIVIEDARIDLVTNLDTMVSFAVTGDCGGFGCLDLVTGAGGAADPSTPQDDYLFSSAGASLTISGDANGASGTLFSGLFDLLSDIVITFDHDATGALTGQGSLTGTLATGTLDAVLAAALGVNPEVITGTSTSNFFRFTFTGAVPFGGGTVTTNTIQLVTAAQVPEPASMALFGLGLLGAGLFRRSQTA